MWCRKLVLLSVASLMSAISVYAAPDTGPWSEIVNGLQGRVLISADPTSDTTRKITVYLELRTVAEPIELYYDSVRTPQCRLLGANDQPLEPRMLPASVFVPGPFWLYLPADSTLRFRISQEGYGIPTGYKLFIPMQCDTWIMELGDERDYELEVTLNVKPPKVAINYLWQGIIKLPRVKIPG